MHTKILPGGDLDAYLNGKSSETRVERAATPCYLKGLKRKAGQKAASLPPARPASRNKH